MSQSTLISQDILRKIQFCLTRPVEVSPNVKSNSPGSYIIEHDPGHTLSTAHKETHKKKETYSSSSQLVYNHTAAELMEYSLLTVINFPRKQMGRFMSDCLTTGVLDTETKDYETKRMSIFACGVPVTANIPPGASVSWFGEEEIVWEENTRDLSWTIVSAEPVTDNGEIVIGKFVVSVDFNNTGTGTDLDTAAANTTGYNSIGILTAELHLVADRDGDILNAEALINKQCMCCLNLADHVPVVMTGSGGRYLVQPLKKCPNGLRLA